MEQLGKEIRIHFAGICGVGTSAVAIALHKSGYRVTGSDKGFYPPVSTALEKAGVTFYAGWHPEQMEQMGTPSMVIAGGGGTSSTNPELKWAEDHNIPILSFAEFVGKYFVRENSIVTVGTWGKTTCAAILAHILTEANYDPTFMIGGVPIGMPSGKLSESDWSVLEGDEYKSAIWDTRAKFSYYSPTHLLLTSVSWDHADLYPTEDAYFSAFENLVSSLPETGLLVACIDNPGVRKVIGYAKCRAVTYGTRSSADYQYVKVGESRDGIRFGIVRGNEATAIESQMIGNFQAENITGCFVLAKEIGIPVKTIISCLASFSGIKRRFEKRFESERLGVTVFDCHAPTPEKAKSVLRDLRKIYDKEKIIAIYEPNIGGRTPESAVKYTDAFSAADIVMIPQLTKLKVDPSVHNKPIDGKDLAKLIARSHSNTQYIPNDDKLVTELINLATGWPSADGTVIVFLGSHSFRTMIEQVVEKLKV
ncbi:MAG: Mur ligase family protein [Patescibacteria group bacterium]